MEFRQEEGVKKGGQSNTSSCSTSRNLGATNFHKGVCDPGLNPAEKELHFGDDFARPYRKGVHNGMNHELCQNEYSIPGTKMSWATNECRCEKSGRGGGGRWGGGGGGG